MKLIYHLSYRVIIALTIVLMAWGTFFYFAIFKEINEEVDDSLSDYATMIIQNSLSGEDLPRDRNSNNQYYLTLISAREASQTPSIAYKDSMVYIPQKDESEPARVLNVIFRDRHDRYLKLTVLTPTIEKEDLIEAFRIWLLFLYATLLCFLIGLIVWVFRKSLKPLYVLLDWLGKYRLGSSNEPLINKTDVTEFKQLNDSILGAYKRNESQFKELKQSIGDASHEVQTPLAISIGQIEMLLENESLTEEQAEGLGKVHQTLQYLTRLNKSILLLAKIDNSQYVDIYNINMGNVLDNYLSDYMDIFSSRGIEVVKKENNLFFHEMSETFATILITNLLKNASVHTPEKGKIKVVIEDSFMAFYNTATFGSLDSKKIFKRFYKHGNNPTSTGLGLPICDLICKKSSLYLKYEYKEGNHCFKFGKI